MCSDNDSVAVQHKSRAVQKQWGIPPVTCGRLQKGARLPGDVDTCNGAAAISRMTRWQCPRKIIQPATTISKQQSSAPQKGWLITPFWDAPSPSSPTHDEL